MPVAIDLGVLLAAFAALLVAYGSLYVWRGTGKPFLLSLALVFDISIGIPHVPGRIHFGAVADWLRTAEGAVDRSLGQLVLNCEQAVALLWHGLAAQARLLGKLLGDLAETIETRFHHLVATTLPAQLSALRRSLAHEVQVVRAAVASAGAAAELELARLRVGIDRTAHRLEHTLARGLDATRTRIGELARDARGQLARIGHVERVLTAAGAAALVGAALARIGLGWVRCSRVGKVGKQLCGMNGNLLDTFLLDATMILSTVSLVELASLLVTVTEGLTSTVTAGFRETRGIEPHTFSGYTGTLG